MTRCGPPRELPASIDLSAYRIVQEALTNVVKHARTSSCQVLIGCGHDELVLEVTDNGAGLPAMAGAAAGAAASRVTPGGRATGPAGTRWMRGPTTAGAPSPGAGTGSSACASG